MMRRAPSTRYECTSSPDSGPHRISRSCGYCDSQAMSAPRSTMPIGISNTMPAAECAVGCEAYPIATSREVVVDIKACSTPPATPNSFLRKNSSGSVAPERPRYTRVDMVNFDAFSTTELIACNVVV
eukprot:scaffold77172_cov26-Tisochrysis_lutea.AAC.2